MKSTAFAPAHISGFFQPVYNQKNICKTGSKGAGFSLSSGVTSEVTIESSTTQNIDILVNGKKVEDKVTELALKYLISERPLKITVKTSRDLPVSQGLGISGATALSASMALSKNLDIQFSETLKAAHTAEVKMGTGLGDIIASFIGGFEIRKTPGLPPWGFIEHIPGNYDIVVCVIGKKLQTKDILSDQKKKKNIEKYGRYCIQNILKNPSIENFLRSSQYFTKKSGLANNEIINIINSVRQYGIASMCMLGNSIFSVGKTDELCEILSQYGKVYLTEIDQQGAKITHSEKKEFGFHLK
ncbi:MAG: pantoate kinase [Candidatus Thermoplasmatota archaeon]